MPSAFRFGHFELRPAQRALLLDGEPQRLGGRAFDLLLALVDRRERVVDFDELLDIVWTGLAVEENNLSVHISMLRKLIGTEAIATVRGRGYRFTAPTQVISALDGQGPARQLWLRRGAIVVVRLAAAGAAPGPGATEGSSPHTASAAGPASILAEFETSTPGRTGVRVLDRAPDGCCIAFERIGDAARAALKVQRQGGSQGPAQGVVRVGIAAADASLPEAEGEHEAVALAGALADAAECGDILANAEVVNEFVAGVDGEVDDLGDLELPAGAVRAYRLRPLAARAAQPGLVAAADAGARPVIAVLPFGGLATADPEDLMGEALADDVITALSCTPEFSVISGLSSRRLKRCGLPAEHMAGCLAADYLLTGSYRLASGRIVLIVHLQDLRRGTVLRSLQVEADAQEAFGPMDPLGHRVGREIVHTLFNHAVQQARLRPLPELENYTLLMGAMGLMHRAAFKEFERARAMLDYLAQRPGCAGVASAWLAKWHVLRVVQGWSVDATADSQLALDHVGRSLEEDSRDALALSIGGLVHAYLRKDLNTAGRLYEEAIDANPSEPLAWLFTATRHAYLGQGREAETAGEQALRLSPIDPLKYFFDSLAATAALSNSNWDRSVELSHRSIRANRTHASTWRTLAFALVMLNRVDEARGAVQQLLAIEPGFTVGRFWERFPGRDGPMARPWAEALKLAGLPA